MFSDWYFATELSTWALFVEMVVSGAVVVLAGTRLTVQADRLANHYQLGHAWVGVLLLATVTSLPEVVTGTTAVWIGQADMAFATIFGSCCFNIVLIVLFNAFVGGGSILFGKGRAHTLSSTFGIVLMSIALLGIMLVGKFESRPALAQACEIAIVGVIALTYLLCMRMVYRTELEVNAEPAAPAKRLPRLPGIVPKVAGLSLILVVSAWWMARTGDVLADHPIEWLGRPLGATMVGAVFLAIATSLPEIATGLAAVRMGNLDMALGNIFGSNMFNIFVIPMLKVSSWFSGHTLLMGGEGFDAGQNTIAGLLPILLTAVVVGGLSYRSSRTVLRRFGVDSALIATIYVVGMVLLLSGGAP